VFALLAHAENSAATSETVNLAVRASITFVEMGTLILKRLPLN